MSDDQNVLDKANFGSVLLCGARFSVLLMFSSEKIFFYRKLRIGKTYWRFLMMFLRVLF